MKKEIIEKINLLVEMSGTTNTYETLNEELTSLSYDIETQKKKVRDLKISMVDQKYVKANERIIDENIKIGIENRLHNLEISLTSVKNKIDKVSLEEQESHEAIVVLEHELRQLEHFLESLDLKIKAVGTKDQQIYTFYQGLIDTSTDEVSSMSELLNDKRKAYQQIVTQLETLGNDRALLEEKIKKENEQLEVINASLANPGSYVDREARCKDEELIDRYTEELEELEKKRLEILTDAAYIGHEATELYLDDDRTSALAKIKELVTIVETKPYMTVLTSDLDELLESATLKRDEFGNTIDNKKYTGNDLSIINLRIQYLEKIKVTKEKEKLLLEDEIHNLDENVVKDLATYIEDVKRTRDSLQADIMDYKKVLETNNDFKTPKKKASLRSALKKKQEELKNVESVLLSFENDLELTVIRSRNLETEDLLQYEEEIQQITEEIGKMQKLMAYNTSAKDILAMEKDKDTLKSLNDDVQNILHRKKYSYTPSEIYDELELTLGTMKDEQGEENKVETDDFVDLSEYRIDHDENVSEDVLVQNEENDLTISDEKEEELPSIELNPIEEETPVVDLEPEEGEVKEVFPPRKTVYLEEPEAFELERYKVVKIEPLDETKEVKEEPVKIEALPEEDFMINDFNDTDYISFNDLLEGGSNESEN